MVDSGNDTYLNKSLQRAFAILNCFSPEHSSFTLTELSNRLHIHKSTVYRLLVNLCGAQFLKYDPTTERYSLGLRLFELGAIVLHDMNLPIKARPYLEELRNKTEETVHLGILDGDDVVYVEKFESSQSIKLSGLYGARRSLFWTALGRVLASGMNDKEILERLEQSTPPEHQTEYTITAHSDLMQQIQEVRQTGYSYDNQETEIGLRCIAAPVRDFTGQVVAAVGISGPSFRLTEDAISDFAQWVMDTGMKISNEVGYFSHAHR